MYVFLTACRNEARILPEFLAEFVDMVRAAGIADRSRLYIVDDLSTDRSVDILEEFACRGHGIDLRIVRVPTNLGNQGAMFFGLRHIRVAPDDVLITFDCDGEDDVRQIPSIIELGASNPGKMVMIERGHRRESLLFKVSFACYKVLFRALTRQTIVPNNFLLIPAALVRTLQVSPLAGVHFAYAILRLRPEYVAATRDRRGRYGGQTSQNLFMLVSHGLVGLMVFFEVVVAKIFTLLFLFGAFAILVVTLAVVLPEEWAAAERTLIWCAIAAGVMASALFGLLLSAALALILKLTTFTLTQMVAAQPAGWTPQHAAVSEAPGGARTEESDRRAS